MRRPLAEQPPRDAPQAPNSSVVASDEVLHHVRRIPLPRHHVAGQDPLALAASRTPRPGQENLFRKGMDLPVRVPPESDHDPLDPASHQQKRRSSVARDAPRLHARRPEEAEATSIEGGDVLIEVDWDRNRGGFLLSWRTEEAYRRRGAPAPLRFTSNRPPA